MEGLILAAMGLLLAALAILVCVGGQPLKAEAGGLTGPWPLVAVLVPVTGAAPGLAARLRRLLSQDYPSYQVIFTTRDAADPATAVILSLISDYSRARHVLAGPARRCGQKNQNLLAAVRLAGQNPEILVFCDSNQEAPASWLKELVAPLVRDGAPVSSGFHHAIPQEPGFAALGRAVTVLALYLTRGFRRLNQPWGGATAIRRRLFENLEISKIWAENIVDDVSLAARLARAGLSTANPRGARLLTPLGPETLAGWQDWLTRQWLYLKFCMPATWLAGGLAVHLLLALVILAILRLLYLPLGAGTLFLAGITVLCLYLRSLHPRPGPMSAWLAACFAAIGMASWCHLKTMLTWEMHWRGIVYQVGWRGRVEKVVSSQ